MSFLLSLAESGLIPDALLRHLMQLYLRARLRRGMFAGIEMPEEAHLVQAPLELFERMLGIDNLPCHHLTSLALPFSGSAIPFFMDSLMPGTESRYRVS